MKRLNEREKQTILGLFTVFIISILLASAFIGLSCLETVQVTLKI